MLKDIKILILAIIKEEYSEGEIKRISETFSTTSLFSRYDNKSYSFTNASGQYGRNNGQINNESTTNKIGEGISTSNRTNEINNKDVNTTSFYLQQTQDNQRRTLTQQQQENLKDIKVRDEDGAQSSLLSTSDN